MAIQRGRRHRRVTVHDPQALDLDAMLTRLVRHPPAWYLFCLVCGREYRVRNARARIPICGSCKSDARECSAMNARRAAREAQA